MSITAYDKPCIKITCDKCGTEAGDEDTGSTWHFEDLADAEKNLDEWSISEDRQICHSCAASEICERDGHIWGKWYPVGPIHDGTSVRYCDRDYCDGRETAGAKS